MGFLGFQKRAVRFIMPTSGTKIQSCGHMASIPLYMNPQKDIQIEFKKNKANESMVIKSNCALLLFRALLFFHSHF
jgi:hypothetical protein